MPSKKEQAAQILTEALGGQVETPEPPKPKPQPVPEAPAPEPVSDSQETVDDGDDGPLYLADLADALGVEPADLYDVLVPSQDEGEAPTSLGKLKDAEKLRRQLERKLRGLESDHETARKELDTLRSQGQQAFGGMPPELDQLRLRGAQWHEYLHNNDAYWRQLKEDDPAAFAAEMTQAQMHAQQAATQFQQAFGQWQAYQQKQMTDLLSEKRRKLAEADEAWANEDTRKARYKTISDWLRSEGADVPSNLDQVLIDPGWANALYKASAAAQGLKAAEGGAPRKAGTVKLRRGSLQRGSGSKAKLVDIIKHARDTGKRRDKQAAGEAILTEAFRKKSR